MKNNMMTILMVSALLASGCAIQPKESARGPGGGIVQHIDCNIKGVEACYRIANKRCPNGFTVLSHKQYTPNSAGINMGNGVIYRPGSHFVHDSLTVECATVETGLAVR